MLGKNAGKATKKAHRPRRASGWPAGVGLYHAGARDALRPDDHGSVPVSLASGNRDKTLEERARCGRVAGESAQSPGRGVAPWEIALCVDAGAAHAASVGGQLGATRSRACWHLVAPLGHAQRRAGTDDYRAMFWKEDAWAACLKVLMERPRRRKLQQLPLAAINILYRCDANQQESEPMAA